MSKLVMQPNFRAVGQTHTEWQTFEKPENKRQMCGSQQYLHKVYGINVLSAYRNSWYHLGKTLGAAQSILIKATKLTH